jgi:outer membrane protein
MAGRTIIPLDFDEKVEHERRHLMRKDTFRAAVVGLVVTVGVALFPLSNGAFAGEFGGIEPGKWVLGFRAGFSPLTQQLFETPGFSSSTSVGPLVNFQGLYSVNTWLLVGMMLEWERHGVSLEQTDQDLGHQDTVSVLPTLEVRPVRLGQVIPYVNMSFGVNINSFGEDTTLRVSPSNTFAWRLGWGADYKLNEQFALNMEWAYKRNDGHATINGLQLNDWNASSFGFLFGGKMFF